MLDALLGHPLGHGPADDVARGELVDEPLPSVVVQERAVPAQRLRQQWSRHGRVVQGGRVELDELHVGHRDPGAQRHGDPVAGGLGRVGRDGEQLPRAARGEHHLGRPHLSEHAVGVEGGDAHAPAALDNAGRGRATARAPPPRCARTAETSARSTSAPVAAPPACRTRAVE